MSIAPLDIKREHLPEAYQLIYDQLVDWFQQKRGECEMDAHRSAMAVVLLFSKMFGGDTVYFAKDPERAARQDAIAGAATRYNLRQLARQHGVTTRTAQNYARQGTLEF